MSLFSDKWFIVLRKTTTSSSRLFADDTFPAVTGKDYCSSSPLWIVMFNKITYPGGVNLESENNGYTFKLHSLLKVLF